MPQDVSLTPTEAATLRILAEWYISGKLVFDLSSHKFTDIGLTGENYFPVLSMFVDLGYIVDVMHTSNSFFSMFKINASTVQSVRVIEDKEKHGDIVESVRKTVRNHPVLAWIIILFTILATLVTVLNQAMQLIKALGF